MFRNVILAFIAVFIAFPAVANAASSWSTPCGFGNYRGTSYLSSPCSSSYNCCMPGREPAKVKTAVKKAAVKEPAQPKKIATVPKPVKKSAYNISARLNDIYFAFNSSALTNKDKAILKRDALYLKNNPDIRVQIQSHCDIRGSYAYNKALGLRRLNAAKSYLENLGISANRLESKNFGKTDPICRAHNSHCYAISRTDHFVVISR